MDSNRGTTYSDEQKKIRNRPRKKPTIVALLSGHEEVIGGRTVLVNHMIPIDCTLSDIMIEVKMINKPNIEMSIAVGEGAMRGVYTFDVRRGKTSIDKEVEIRKGAKLQVIVDHPEDFTAEEVYFSSSLKR